MGLVVMNISCVMLVMARLAVSPPVDEPVAVDPFQRAAFAPVDVTMYVHVENAAQLRRELADRPIARWFQAVLGPGDVRRAWGNLAAAARMDEARLFDDCLGRSSTLMIRQPGEWALIAQADPQRMTRMMQQLKPRIREPRHGMSIAELPEQDVLIARNERIVVVGPAAHPSLLYELLSKVNDPPQSHRRMTGEKNGAEADTFDGAIALARSLGQGQIGVMVRHEPPMGGFSVAIAQVRGDEVTLKHAAKFDNAPFTHAITKLRCDFSPVLSFENHALMAFMQPTDIHDGPVESFLVASLGEGLLSGPMRQNLGDRRLIVVDEVEGRLLERPVDLLNTTFVACLQIRQREPAIQELDEQMIKVAGRINALGKGAFLVKTPHVRSMRPEEPREIDLGAAGEWFAGGFPIMQNIALTWTVAEGPQGAWYVIGSNRRSLEDVATVLRNEPVRGRALTGRYESCGVGNGVRLSRHLRSWSARAADFADPEGVDEVRSTLEMMSELAGGMQICRWQLERPSQNEMRLNVQIKLAPPESARAE